MARAALPLRSHAARSRARTPAMSGSSGTAQAKKEALEAAGVKVGKTPSETAQLMREILG